MEQIELYDPSINKLFKVKVPSKIAERCRKNPEFAQALFEEIHKENIEDGSILDVATSDIEDEENLVETTNDFENWSDEETQKLLDVLKKGRHLSQIINDGTNDNDMSIWKDVSKDLATFDVNKSAEECKFEWNRIQETQNNSKNQSGSTLQHLQQISDIMNDSQVDSSEFDDEDDPTYSLSDLNKSNNPYMEREKWTQYETLKFLKTYQAFKRKWKTPCLEKKYWMAISKDLAKHGIQKNYKKCEYKWRNLLKAYKNLQKGNVSQRFPFQQHMEDIIKGVDLKDPPEQVNSRVNEREAIQSEEDVSQDCKRLKLSEEVDFDDGCFSHANWSDKETSKLIEAFKKHKKNFGLFTGKKVWELISLELAIAGVQKDAEKCQTKWKNLKRSYRNCQLLNSPFKKFNFSEELKNVLDEESNSKEQKYSELNTKNDDSEDEKLDETAQKNIGNGASKKDNFNNSNDFEWKDGKWTKFMTIALIDAYREQKETQTKDKTIDWLEISATLSSKGIKKSSEECQKKWSILYKDYVANKFKLGEGTFAFQTEIDSVFEKKAVEAVKVIHCDKCRCCEKKMADKQKRHTDRMNLIKMRLEVEQRKVLAFEKYLSTISS